MSNEYIGKYMKCSCGDIFKVISYDKNKGWYYVYYISRLNEHSNEVLQKHIEEESKILTKDEAMLEAL
jgi:hypothetical protein